MHCFWTFCCLSYLNLSSTYKSSLLLLFFSAIDNCTLSSFSDFTFPVIFDPASPSPCATWKFWKKKFFRHCSGFSLLCCVLHWHHKIINCLCLDSSGSLYCKFIQPNFDCIDANALQTAEAFKLQSPTVKRGKSPSPLTLCSIQSFMILQEISLNVLNLKVSLLQSSCRVHNWFIQSSC